MADIVVNIYLNIPGSGAPFQFLSIPYSDIQRLSIHPFKWLRYLMFSICGAPGDLSETPDGPPVSYDGTLLAEVPYYYSPSQHCIFVDCDGINDQITKHRACSKNFRDGVVQRDGSCLITRTGAAMCDAAHLIPRSKSDEYIMQVIQERFCLYDSTPPRISGINDIQNGVLLDKILHALLRAGHVAFLKTPNYGLQPIDIPAYQGHMGIGSGFHMTLQHLKKYHNDNPAMCEYFAANSAAPELAFRAGASVDAMFQGTGASQPPDIILDYAYGVAAYRCWKSKNGLEGQDMMRRYHTEHYTNLSTSGLLSEGNLNSPDYPPSSDASTNSGEEMAKAMDEVNAVLMWVQGITPQEATKRREKQVEEQYLKAQEVSQNKVMEWQKQMGVL